MKDHEGVTLILEITGVHGACFDGGVGVHMLVEDGEIASARGNWPRMDRMDADNSDFYPYLAVAIGGSF